MKQSVLNIITVLGVEGYADENGMAWLRLEHVARGLGFMRGANSGNEVIRWERVRRYLEEIAVPTSGHGKNDKDLKGKEGLSEFISENIFYKLCFKAENETARKFQDLVTDEILPSIRKHGAYIKPHVLDEMISSPEFGIKLLIALKDEQIKLLTALKDWKDEDNDKTRVQTLITAKGKEFLKKEYYK